MNRKSIGLSFATAFLLAPPALAVLDLDPPPGADRQFHDDLRKAIALLERARDPLIPRLVAAARAAPATITVREITADNSPWHESGDADRGHTDPADGKPKRRCRAKPADAIVYVMRSGVQPGTRRWKNGLLVHELVHALDLAAGRFHADGPVRERRAVFVQNVWRSELGYPLRADYHDRFATLDYQEAAKKGALARYAEYIFTRADFPPPPAGK